MSRLLSVMIMRIALGTWERCEVGTWLAHCFCDILTGKVRVAGLPHGVIDTTPTTAARNSAVIAAQSAGVDVLVQVDNDMAPSLSFFAHAIEFLAARPGAVCIGSPYCSGPPGRHVHVTRRTDFERWTRAEAAEKTGDEVVGCIGTGLLACRMECFELVGPPWFDYEYTNELRGALGRSEDFYFCRRLTEKGGRVYCAWDHWSGHAKTELVGKPEKEHAEARPQGNGRAAARAPA